jgi:holo-[acyl-carrier protein] synthase
VVGHDSVRGIGTDLVAVERFAQPDPRLLARLFTPAELAELDHGSPERRAERFAGRWAAKEAVVKALGTGFAQGIRFHDIEISRGVSGQPTVQLHAAAAQHLQALAADRLLLSISHDGGFALAFAVAVHG